MSSLQYPKKKKGKVPPSTSSPLVGAPSQANLAARAAAMARAPGSPSSMGSGSWQPPRVRPSSASSLVELDEHKWMGWGKNGPDTEALSAEKARDERLKSVLRGVKDRPASTEPRSAVKKPPITKKIKPASPKPKKRIVPRYPTLQSTERRVVPAGSNEEGSGDSDIYRKLLEETTMAAESAMNELISDGGVLEKSLMGNAGLTSESEMEQLRRVNQRARESYPAAPVGSRTQIYAPREAIVSENTKEEEKEDKSDPKLVSVMAMRLNKLERLVRRLNTEIAEKDAEIRSLKRQSKGGNKSKSSNSVQKANDRLRKEIQSMHTFLADYGLTWIGEPTSSDEDDKSELRRLSVKIEDLDDCVQWGGDGSPRSPYRETVDKSKKVHEYDVRALLSRIKELNYMAGDGTTAFKRGADGRTHKLQPPSTLRLALYNDGIMLRSGPFRSMSDDATQLFITDLLDGFFPYELKSQFPDGVVFDVVDRSMESYSIEQQDVIPTFPGTGQMLGGTETPPITVHVKSREESSNNIHQLGEDQMHVPSKTVIDRLPESVVRNGKVVRIRADADELLKGREEARVIQMDSNVSGNDESTLRIKSKDLDAVYLVKLPKTATIQDLRSLLTNEIGSDVEYELRTAFPAVAYIDLDKSLVECGLYPTATLFMK